MSLEAEERGSAQRCLDEIEEGHDEASLATVPDSVAAREIQQTSRLREKYVSCLELTYESLVSPKTFGNVTMEQQSFNEHFQSLTERLTH